MAALLTQAHPASLQTLRVEVNDLRKFAVLNYVAVVKGVKKRNRHLRKACGIVAMPLAAVPLLSDQPFFTSTRLAALSTQADLLAEVSHSGLAGALMLFGLRLDNQAADCDAAMSATCGKALHIGLSQQCRRPFLNAALLALG